MEARALKVTSYPTLKVKGREGAAPERAHWKMRLAPQNPWSLPVLIPSKIMSLMGIRDVVNLLSMPAK